MSLVLLLWLLAVSERLVILDETVSIPAGRSGVVELGLKQRVATVECEFEVVKGGSGVRVALLSRHDAERFRSGRSHQVVVSTTYRKSGRLRAAVPVPDDYVLLVDNRLEGRGAADVKLTVALAFDANARQQVGVLPPHRRLIVVLCSLWFLVTVVVVVGRRLRRAMFEDRPPEAPFSA